MKATIVKWVDADLSKVGLEHGQEVEVTPELLFKIYEHFNVMLLRRKADITLAKTNPLYKEDRHILAIDTKAFQQR